MEAEPVDPIDADDVVVDIEERELRLFSPLFRLSGILPVLLTGAVM